jgi:hypothetical protein
MTNYENPKPMLSHNNFCELTDIFGAPDFCLEFKSTSSVPSIPGEALANDSIATTKKLRAFLDKKVNQGVIHHIIDPTNHGIALTEGELNG